MAVVVLCIKRDGILHLHHYIPSSINISSTLQLTNHKMSTTAASSLPDSICANCGKGEESSGDLKACTACKLVKYCNRECQIAHRPQHKRDCKKRAAELYDKQLFKEPPPREECPICMLPLPLDGSTFHPCCGKLICDGCIYAMTIEGVRKGTKKEEMGMCAFCRTLRPISNEEKVKRLKGQMEKDNAMACLGSVMSKESMVCNRI